jgi:uncharacterized cupredoxin-like copper-binding protein
MSQMMGEPAFSGHAMALHAVPTAVPAGTVSLVAANVGRLTHELVVLPLAPGAVVGARSPGPEGQVDEDDSLGEASRSCSEGSGEGIEVGTEGWITLTLPRGRYELVCNLAGHYAAGMSQELVVS